MSEGDTELELSEEPGVEDAGFDDDAAEGVEVGAGCVVGDGVDAGSNTFPESGVPFTAGVVGWLPAEDVGVEGFGA